MAAASASTVMEAKLSRGPSRLGTLVFGLVFLAGLVWSGLPRSRAMLYPMPNASVFQSVTFLLPFIHIIILLTTISLLPHPPSEAILVASPLLSKRRVPLATAQRAAVHPPRSRKLLFCLRALLSSAARSLASQLFGRTLPAFIGGMHVQ